MSFKIIQELNKHKNAVLTIIPERFENNGVYWFPPSNWSTRKLNNVLRNAFAVPNISVWEARPCVVKKKNIQTFALAEELEEELLQKTVTEADDADAESEASETYGMHQHQQEKRATATRSPQADFNFVLENCQEKVLQTNSQEGQVEIFNLDNLNNIDYLVNTSNKNEDNVLLCSGSTRTEQPNAEASVNQMVDNQEKILQILLNIQEMLTIGFSKLLAQGDCLTEFQNLHLYPNTKEQRFSGAENFNKVETGEQASQFEKQLLNEQFQNEMIQNMSFIIGKNGKRCGDGWTCCYELIDSIFHRSFLTKCSWTGASTSQQEEGKIPFFKFKNVLTLFAKVVIDADPEFSMEKTKEFFKKLLRNSTRFQNQEISQTRKSTKRERGPRKKTTQNSISNKNNCETSENLQTEQIEKDI